jgi:hypothetical protein
VFRGLEKPEKVGFTRNLIKGIRPVRVRTPAGLHLGWGVVSDVDLTRLDRVVDRITRGLYWYHLMSRIPDEFEVAVYSEDGMRAFGPPEIERIQKDIVTPVLNSPPHSIGRGVMRYWYASASDRTDSSVWIYEFYEDVKFVALVMPPSDARMSVIAAHK